LSLKVHDPVHNSPSLDPCVLAIHNINIGDEKYLVNHNFIIVTRNCHDQLLCSWSQQWLYQQPLPSNFFWAAVITEIALLY